MRSFRGMHMDIYRINTVSDILTPSYLNHTLGLLSNQPLEGTAIAAMYRHPTAFGNKPSNFVWWRGPTATRQLGQQGIHPNHQHPTTPGACHTRATRISDMWRF